MYCRRIVLYSVPGMECFRGLPKSGRSSKGSASKSLWIAARQSHEAHALTNTCDRFFNEKIACRFETLRQRRQVVSFTSWSGHRRHPSCPEVATHERHRCGRHKDHRAWHRFYLHRQSAPWKLRKARRPNRDCGSTTTFRC